MANDTHTTLAAMIRHGRQQAGLSIRQLATAVGIHYSVLSRIETGQVTHPSADIVHHLADTLDLDPVVLLGFIGVRLPDTVTFLRHRYQLDHDHATTVAAHLDTIITNLHEHEGRPPS